MENKFDWKYWFEYAENDFEAATILANQIKPKIEIVCYHCQQCVEKSLKGYLASKGEKLQKTHDLVVLCQKCIEYDNSFETVINNCSDLTIYASEIRYPNILEIEIYHMQKAINDAIIIRNFVNNKLSLSL